MKHYDKVFFVVSILVLGASCGYYFTKKPELLRTQERVEDLLQQKAEGVQWKEIVVPQFKAESIEWPEIVAQDEEGRWFFQVFTPPQIWVDKDGKFITESPYIKEVARQAFALKYGGVSNEPYPIKYAGFFGTKEAPIVQFVNTTNKMGFIGKLNEEIIVPEPSTGKPINTGLTLKSFDKKRIKNPDNTISDIVTLSLFDKKLGKTIVIQSDKPTVLEDQRRVSFVLPDGSQWHVKKAGESKEIGGARYEVKSIDFDKNFAVVEMIPSNKDVEPQKMKLSPEGVVPADK